MVIIHRKASFVGSLQSFAKNSNCIVPTCLICVKFNLSVVGSAPPLLLFGRRWRNGLGWMEIALSVLKFEINNLKLRRLWRGFSGWNWVGVWFYFKFRCLSGGDLIFRIVIGFGLLWKCFGTLGRDRSCDFVS